MTKKLLNLIMKYPLQFLCTSFTLIGVFPLAILLLKFYAIINLGITSIIFFGCVFGVCPMFLWWMVSYVMNRYSFYEKKITNTTIEYDQEKISWLFNITVGSIINGIFCIIILGIAYFFHWKFRTFLLWCILIPIIRIIQYLLLDRRFFKNKEVRDFFKY